MKEKIIDANIILRFLMGDVPEQLKGSKTLIKRIEEREETGFLPLLCAFETVFTLEKFYRISKKEIEEKLSMLFSLTGLHLPLKSIFLQSLKTYREKNIDFADAFTIVQMKKLSIKEIYSYDKDFDGFEGIKRIEP